jgi:integrase
VARSRADSITLHDARYTYASLLIAAEDDQHLHGHASVTITLDRYGHLMPGSEQEVADLLDAHIASAKRRA